MKRFITYIVLLFLFCEVSLAQNSIRPQPAAGIIPGCVYVTFKPSRSDALSHVSGNRTGIGNIDKVFSALGVNDIVRFDPSAPDKIDKKYGLDRTYTVFFSGEYTPEEACKMLAGLNEVKCTAMHRIFESCYTPNDPHVGDQWYLTNMKVKEAWGYSKGDHNVVIAIVDDGLNYNHEDLSPNIDTNYGEWGPDGKGGDKSTNGKDDDGDGYKDNWRGWDFVGNIPDAQADTVSKWKPDNDPMPGASINSHGTRVAGCASAAADNAKGLAGIGFKCSLLPLKSGNDNGHLVAGYESIDYASKHNAKIINCSWGGTLTSFEVAYVQNIIDAVTERGSLVVAAAGNFTSNNDNNPFYPASLDKVLSVGATDQSDKAASFSNYGKTVDVFAPGTGIFTTGHPGDNVYDASFGGTSAAAPVTCGVLGLLATKKPDLTPKFLTRIIVETCDKMTPNDQNHHGRINALSALTTPGYPGLSIQSFTVDGVDGVDAELLYINKPETVAVEFKNVVDAGSGLQVTLLPTIDSYSPTGTATAFLGTMAEGEVKTGNFIFTRDPNSAGVSSITLNFYVTDGNKYKDTLSVTISVIGDEVWIPSAVKASETKAFSLGLVYPNPARERVTLPLSLSERMAVNVKVVDVLGRGVYTQTEQVFEAGSNYIDIDTHSFAAGMYFIVITDSHGGMYTRAFTVTK